MPSFRYRLSTRVGPITIEDYRALARRSVPDMVWGYVDTGAEGEVTVEANRAAFARRSLRQLVLTGKEASDLRVTVAGTELSLPVLLAPVATVALSHWSGELGAAGAAEAMGTRAVLSTASNYSIEEVAKGTTAGHFFQLYPYSLSGDPDGRAVSLSLIDRAKAAGFAALFVTVDTPARSNRDQEIRRAAGVPPILTPRRLLDAAVRPRWWYEFLRHRRTGARSLQDELARSGIDPLAADHPVIIRPRTTWEDLAWMRDRWGGPFYVKGLLDASDAQRAVDLGADGVVVSNHGGRQLAHATASLDALGAVVDQVGGRAQVLLDGGVRRGSDIAKALCLGADAVLIGRPYLYGLAAKGPAGVRHVLEILGNELRTTMTLMGVERLDELDRSWLLPASTAIGGAEKG